MPNVFWSWQSDAPARETKQIIREALEEAVASINGDIQDSERPDEALTVDHDTKGVPGSPDIVASILEKIEKAQAFVADVTPIGIVGVAPKVRHVANPNVMIELGYAKKALGLDRIIQVWNTAITDCTVNDLPFDMRGRRGPISFHLPAGSPTEDYRNAKSKLAASLRTALSIVPGNAAPLSSWPNWHRANEVNPAIWFEEGAGITVNEPGHGSGKKSFPTAATRYVRILPRAWNKPQEPDHSSLLGHVSGVSWGRASGGLLTYEGSIVRPELADSPNGTMLFFDTGETWAIDRFIVAEWRDKQMIQGDEILHGVISYLSRQVPKMLGQGASLPMRIKLGTSGLLESYWPIPNPFYGEPQALDDGVEIEGQIDEFSQESISRVIMDFWTALRDNYGLGPPDEGRIVQAMQFFRR